MKKIFWTIIVLIITESTFGQTKKITLIDKDMGGLFIKYMKYIDLEKEDTSYLVWIGFRNARYTSLVDIESIAFEKDEENKKFIKDLAAALKQMESKENVSMSWDRSDYSIRIREGEKGLFLYNENNKGYIWLNKKYVEKLLYQLNRITFGSDIITPESK